MRKPIFGGTDPQGDVRLGELILYVADKCTGDRLFGAIKLNKILWWSDFLAYGQHGAPITGVEYQRLDRGPAPRRLVPIRDGLVANGDAVVQPQRVLGGLVQERVIPLRPPKLDLFTASQIELVNDVIQLFWGRSARDVSRLSHGKAWEIAGHGEGIPYQAVFLSDAPVNALDRDRARELAERYGW